MRNTGKLRGIFGLLVCGVGLSACNTTSTMVVPKVQNIVPLQISASASQQASFALSKVVANIKRGTVIGHYPAAQIEGVSGTLCNYRRKGKATMTWGAGSSILGNWSTELGEVFYEALSQSGVNVAGDPRDLFGQEQSARSAEYLIGGRITKIASNICQEHDLWYGLPQNSFSGEFFVNVEWTIFSSLTQKTALKFETQGYHKQAEPKPDSMVLMFHNAFAHAAENMLSNKRFIELTERNSGTPAVASFLGAEIRLAIQPPLGEAIQDNLDDVLSSVATIRVGQGHGSGFFVTDDGYLLTNSHVVGNANQVSVILSNGLEVPGQVVRRLESRDVALVKVGLRIPKALSVRGDEAKKLERIFVIGTPIKEGLSSTVTSGIISGLRTEGGQRFIQADAPISPGNSGGPLLDQNGNVLGISVAKIAGGGAEGIGLFIPINDAFSSLKVVPYRPGS